MAATMGAWAKPGAWALDSEENEEELLHQHNENHHSNGGGTALAALSDFPSLATAATTKTKKKRAVTLSLQEFSSYDSVKPSQTVQPKGLTSDSDYILMNLPTGPSQRTAEELDRSRGFRSYGVSSFDRTSRGSSDEPRRQGGFGRDSNREFAPSRADENDDWGASKKSTFGNGFDRRESRDRGAFFSDSHSRADEFDSWVSNKTFVPSEGRRFERRRGGFESNGGASDADSDNWTKKKEEEGPKMGSAFDSLRERRGGSFANGRDGGELDNWGKREEVSSRRKLNLQPRTLPVGEVHQKQQDGSGKPKGSSPFGDARPREEVLKEKGQDWKEIDEKLELSNKVNDVGSWTNGSSFGKRDSNNGNARDNSSERSWRKPDFVDASPASADQIESKVAEEEDYEPQVEGCLN